MEASADRPPWWPGPVWFPSDQLSRDIAVLKERLSANSLAGASTADKQAKRRT